MIGMQGSLKFVCLTSSKPYLGSSRKSRTISTELYQPLKGAAGNCKPPTSKSIPPTEGIAYHFSPKSPISGMLSVLRGKVKFSLWMMRLLQVLKNLTWGVEWVLVVPRHPEEGTALVCHRRTEPVEVHQTCPLPLSSQVFHRTESEAWWC